MDFFALDVETANPDLASICQIGLVAFEGGRVVQRWRVLVNPEDYFDNVNVAAHGITPQAVKDALTFPKVSEQLCRLLAGQIVATHMPFDQIALARAAEKYHVPGVVCKWLDTARVARRAWPQFRQRGYNLPNLAREFGISFRHHDAEEDARAAGEVLLRAMSEAGMSVEEWLVKAYRPASSRSGRWSDSRVAREGNPDGPLDGEVIVFTGALSMSREQAATAAATAGCDVRDGVTKQTTLLVVGEQDFRMLAGKEKSGKHRKAEELIAKGHNIRILGEGDFVRLVGL